MPAVIENIGVPMGMEPLARIFMLIKSCPIKAGQRKIIGGKMGRHPIEDHADPLLMEMIDKILKIFRRAKAACRGIKTGDLIAPRFIERMLANRHQFDMGKSHLFAVCCQFMGKFAGSQDLFSTSPDGLRRY